MELAHEARGKRKMAPAHSDDRPTKQLKPDAVDTPDIDDGGEPNGTMDGLDSDGDVERMLPLAAMAADSAEWQATIEAVVRNVVSIRFCQTCSFDTDPAVSSEATGFVVDSERGYILTNRHVSFDSPENVCES